MNWNSVLDPVRRLAACAGAAGALLGLVPAAPARPVTSGGDQWVRIHDAGNQLGLRYSIPGRRELRLAGARTFSFETDSRQLRVDGVRVWMTAAGAMPEDPVLHTAAMIYSSDTTVLDSIITTHGLSWGWDRIFAVTINHSVWFHRQVDFSEWVLYSTASPAAADSRGLGMGHFFNRAGEVVATVAQEGIVKHFGKSGRD